MSNKLRSIKRDAGTTEVEVSSIPPELKGDVDEISSYIKNFIDNRYPNGVNDDVREVLSEMVLDAFCDGMKYAENMQPEKSLIIQP